MRTLVVVLVGICVSSFSFVSGVVTADGAKGSLRKAGTMRSVAKDEMVADDPGFDFDSHIDRAIVFHRKRQRRSREDNATASPAPAPAAVPSASPVASAAASGPPKFPVATCGGVQDTEGQKQMEQANGKPCKFPFTYKGTEYNACTSEDMHSGHEWCRTEFPPPGQDGPIRWAICNPENKPCPANAADEGAQQAAAEAARRVQKATDQLSKWFSWPYWEPLILCVLVILIWSEIIWPFVDHAMEKPSLLLHAIMFCLQMFCFMVVGAIFMTPGAAGTQHIMGLSMILVMMSFMILIFALAIRCRHYATTTVTDARHYKETRTGISLVADDMSVTLRPISRFVAVLLLVLGILDDVSVDFSGLAALAAVGSIGIALAVSGIASDLFAYICIRMFNYFEEGDMIWITLEGEECCKVLDISFRATTVYRGCHCSPWIIPNSKLVDTVNNQTRDTARRAVKTIPLEPSLSAQDLEDTVKQVWALLKSYESGFTAKNGTPYANQIDIGSSAVYVSDNSASVSAKELRQISLSIKLIAKYWYSHAPPWTDESKPEPAMRDRQWDWLMPWNYQLEHLFVELQKVLDRKKPGIRG